jgi:uncharacterized protein YbjT (DUF2867 family)
LELKMTILITGATGQVGGEAARVLAASGQTVRALVRDPARAAGLDGVEIIQGSFEDDASLRRALDDVHAVLLTSRDSPNTVAQQLNVLKHVRQSAVTHVVKLSAIGASTDAPIELMRDHQKVDDKLLEGPANWTLLKPHLYMQNLTRAADTARSEGRLPAPMGERRIPLIDTRDIGAAAATVLTDPGTHTGKTYRLTGPQGYSYYDVAAALSGVLNRPVIYEPVSPDAFEARLLAAGMPDWRAFDLAHIASAYNPEDLVVSPAFEALVGRRPTSLSAFLADHRDVFVG